LDLNRGLNTTVVAVVVSDVRCSLDGGDRCQGQLRLLVLVVDQLMLLPPPAAEGLQAIPDSRVHHEVAERSGSIVAELPEQGSRTILNLVKRKRSIRQEFP